MGILGIINLFKKVSLFLLRLQEQLITMQLSFFLNRNKKHLKNVAKGCSIAVKAELEAKKSKLEDDIKNLLKKFNNDASLIIDYILKHKTKVFKISNANELLTKIGEEQGLIVKHTGTKALFINVLFFKKISFKSEPLFVIDEKEVDIYYLIQQFHKWYFMRNDFSGFDEKSQKLLKDVNGKGNTDSIISKLKPDDIVKLQDAIARDVESISFVEKYARETGGSKKALEKIKNGVGAKI